MNVSFAMGLKYVIVTRKMKIDPKGQKIIMKVEKVKK